MIFLLIPALLVLASVKLYRLCIRKKRVSLRGKHVVITGGSSGIGKSFALLAAKEGAHVTILARNIDKLTEAQREIQSHTIDAEQQVTKVSVDITNYEGVENNLHEVEATVGPIYMLVNCTGNIILTKCENLTEQEIKLLVDSNLLGSIYATKAIIPKFKERNEGIIILTSSALGLVGLYGSTVYSACKFALRGLAESLYMEIKPYNISVTLSLPLTGNPPASKEKKAEETQMLPEPITYLQPDVVAKKMLDDAMDKKFFSYVGFESWMLALLCVGMSPPDSIVDILLEASLLGTVRIISTFYIKSFHKFIKKSYLERSETS